MELNAKLALLKTVGVINPLTTDSSESSGNSTVPSAPVMKSVMKRSVTTPAAVN